MERKSRLMAQPRLGEVVMAERLRERLTRSELAYMVHVHEATVRSWERGRTEPNASDLLNLAEALGPRLWQCLTGKPQFEEVKAS